MGAMKVLLAVALFAAANAVEYAINPETYELERKGTIVDLLNDLNEALENLNSHRVPKARPSVPSLSDTAEGEEAEQDEDNFDYDAFIRRIDVVILAGTPAAAAKESWLEKGKKAASKGIEWIGDCFVATRETISGGRERLGALVTVILPCAVCILVFAGCYLWILREQEAADYEKLGNLLDSEVSDSTAASHSISLQL